MVGMLGEVAIVRIVETVLNEVPRVHFDSSPAAAFDVSTR